MDTLFPYTTLFRSLGSRMVSDLPIREALDRVGTYPPQLRRRLLPLFMEAALRERRHAEALQAAAALTSIATTPGEAAAAAFVEGQIAHREGRPNEAVRRFEQSATLGGPWGAKAELAVIEIGRQSGDLTPESSEERLRRAALDWRGGNEEIQALETLADTLSASGDAAALGPLSILARRFPDDPRGRAAAEKAGAILDAFYRDAEVGAVDAARLTNVHSTYGTEIGDAVTLSTRSLSYARGLQALGLSRAAEQAYRRAMDAPALASSMRTSATEALAELLIGRGAGDEAETLLQAIETDVRS